MFAIPPSCCHQHHNPDDLRHVFRVALPISQFLTSAIESQVCMNIMWEATEHLERSDYIVTLQTGDGGSPHRKYFKLH